METKIFLSQDTSSIPTMSFRQCIRRLHLGNKSYKCIKTVGEFENYLNSSSWSIKELLQPTTTTPQDDVSPQTIQKILKLSGLNASTDTKDIAKSLKLQMMFISHLYDTEDTAHLKANGNNCRFRLIASDHIAKPPLNLDMLKEQIQNSKPSEEKGEFGFDISKLQRESFEIKKKTK
ncbi:GTF1 Glutamyl-tRNA(Gln) amidotransferase subunit F [Candida maltosa Xu316]